MAAAILVVGWTAGSALDAPAGRSVRAVAEAPAGPAPEARRAPAAAREPLPPRGGAAKEIGRAHV